MMNEPPMEIIRSDKDLTPYGNNFFKNVTEIG